MTIHQNRKACGRFSIKSSWNEFRASDNATNKEIASFIFFVISWTIFFIITFGLINALITIFGLCAILIIAFYGFRFITYCVYLVRKNQSKKEIGE